MNDQLQESIKQMIDKSVAAIEKGADFASEQIPDIIQQYLMWAFTERVLYVLLAIATVTTSYKAFTKWTNQELEYGMWKSDKFIAAMFGGVLSLITTLIGIVSIFGLAQILVAPKVFLLEKFMSLVK